MLQKNLLLVIFLGQFFFQPQNVESLYNPWKFLAQNFYTTYGNEYRSANGAPGAKYWQNR